MSPLSKLFRQTIVVLSFSAFAVAQLHAGEDVRNNQSKTIGVWHSSERCVRDDCHWEAFTLGEKNHNISFVVKTKEDETRFELRFFEVSMETFDTFKKSLIVPVGVKFRIDNGNVYETRSRLRLWSNIQSMNTELYFGESTQDILNDLKRGKKLRVRLYTLEGNFSESFYLLGSSESIDRIQKGPEKKLFNSKPDPFFDNVP